MTQKINVIAMPGVEVPRHDDPKRYITDSEAMQVDDCAYYRRCIAGGDLKLVANTQKPKATKSVVNDGQ